MLADPGCRACKALVPELATWAREHPEVEVVVAARVPMRKLEVDFSTPNVRVVVDRDRTAKLGLGGVGYPAAVLVADDGRTASEVAMGATAVQDLLESVGSRPALGTIPVTLEEASTPDERSRPIAEVVGEDVDLLFVMTTCPHCRSLAAQIRSEGLDLAAPGRQRPVVVVSSGTFESTRELGIAASRTVYDLSGALLLASGAPGTPALVSMVGGRARGPVSAGTPSVIEALARSGATSVEGAT